jgi:hypothetical protein
MEVEVSDFLKGVTIMSGFLARALSGFLLENEEVLMHARIVAGLAACKDNWVEEVREHGVATDGFCHPTVKWTIEFSTVEDAKSFSRAVSAIVEAVHREEE